MSHHDEISKVLALRPQNAIARMGADNNICLLNLKDILKVLKDKPVILMACNIRIKHVIPGIMRAAEELDAVLGFEAARSECNLDGGYTGFTPEILFDTVIEYAKETNFTKPFYIHADHITIKTTYEEAIVKAQALIAAHLKAGFTSFAIDASFNQIPDNVKLTTILCQPIIEQGLSLEVEVGEVKSTGTTAELSTVEDATSFISGLKANNVHPDLLAINNGSKHGNYLAGEAVSIDLDTTLDIYNAIKGDGLVIAQHGITGTPLNVVGKFADYGIRKGNVGTQWQNIAHEFIPEALMNEMKAWAKAEDKNIKMATKPFKEKIDNIPEENKKQIADKAYEVAKDFIKAFHADGTASDVINGLGK
ncbi:class II fructose-bisphosphate aldolase [Thermodesulfobacteriota bacterium]